VNLDELMVECIDALQGAGWDGRERSEHLEHIEKALQIADAQSDTAELLRAVAAHFRENALISELKQALVSGEKSAALAEALKQKVGSVPYVYHGTVLGRLSGIAREGLVPGKFPVWKKQHVPGNFLKSSVFFTTTWRGAMSWAEATHSCSKGRRDGPYRTPAVIRLPASGLILQPDPRATASGCFMVSGTVHSDDACVIVGRVRGFPTWRPIHDAVEAGH
jgi:hypothetical protein